MDAEPRSGSIAKNNGFGRKRVGKRINQQKREGGGESTHSRA